jgi:hypothetical protein
MVWLVEAAPEQRPRSVRIGSLMILAICRNMHMNIRAAQKPYHCQSGAVQ